MKNKIVFYNKEAFYLVNNPNKLELKSNLLGLL